MIIDTNATEQDASFDEPLNINGDDNKIIAPSVVDEPLVFTKAPKTKDIDLLKVDEFNTAIIKSAVGKTNILDEVNAIKTDLNFKETSAIAIQELEKQEESIIVEALSGVNYESKEEVNDYSDVATSILIDKSKKYNGVAPLAEASQSALVSNADFDVDEQILKTRLNKEKYIETIGQIHKDIGYGEIGLDVTKAVLFGPKELHDISQAKGIIEDAIESSTGRKIDLDLFAEDWLEQTSDAIFSLPHEKQIEQLDVVLNRLLDVLPRTDVVTIMEAIVRPEMATNPTSGFNLLSEATFAASSLDAATIISGIVSKPGKAVIKGVKSFKNAQKIRKSLVEIHNETWKKINQKNIINDLAETGNIEDAAKINAKAVDDEVIRKDLNAEVAVDNASEIPHDKSNVGTKDDLVVSSQNKLIESKEIELNKRKLAFESESEQAVDDLFSQEKGVFRESVLPKEELEAISIATSDELLKMLKITNENVVNKSAKLKNVNEDGMVITFEVVEPKTGVSKTMTEEYVFKIKDNGALDLGQESLLSHFTSPTFLMQKTKDKGRTLDTNRIEFTDSALRNVNTEAKIANTFKQLYTKALSPVLGGKHKQTLKYVISKKARQELSEIDRVLRLGDEFVDGKNNGKVWSTTELQSGELGVTLSDKQVEVYNNIRSVYDQTFRVSNKAAREQKIIEGKRFIELDLPKAKVEGIAKIFDDINSFKLGIGAKNPTNKPRLIMDPETGTYIDVTRKSEIDGVYKSGRVIAHLESSVKVNGSNYTYIIVKKDAIKDLPNIISPKREGYVAKFFNKRDEAWFVKGEKSSTVNGVDNMEHIAIRRFDNEFDAKLYAERLKKKALSKNTNGKLKSTDIVNDDDLLKIDDKKYSTEYKAVSDRQIMGVAQGESTSSGSRTTRTIEFGLPEKDRVAKRKDSFTALNQSIYNVSGKITRNKWRFGREQMLLNAASQNGMPRFDNLSDLKRHLVSDISNTNSRTLLEDVKQFEIWSAKRTSEEQWWDNLLQKHYEGALRRDPNRWHNDVMVRILRSEALETDPLTLLRGFAFNNLLGYLNPIQIVVQAQNAAIAVSLNPVLSYHKLINESMYLITNGNVDMGRAFNKIYNLDVKGEKLLDLEAMGMAFNRSGFKDSIMDVADYKMAYQGRNVVGTALSGMSDVGLSAYRAGEFGGRTIAWSVASRAYSKKINKALRDFDNNDWKQVISDTDFFLLNMNRANRSKLQINPVTATATQFQHVMARYGEMFFSPKLTASQKLRVATGQIVMFGGAGLPFGQWAASAILSGLGYTQEDIDNMPPEAVSAINGGVYDSIVQQALGVDASLSDRVGLGKGVENMVKGVVSSEVNILSAFGGPGGSIASKIYDAMNEYKVFYVDPVLGGGEVTSEHFTALLDVLSSPISSINNVQKALVMEDLNAQLNSRGQIIGNDYNWQTIASQALGLSSNVSNTTYNLKKSLQYDKDLLAAKKALIMEVETRISLIIKNDPTNKKEIERLKLVLGGAINNAPERMKGKLRKFQGKLYSKNTAEYTQQNKVSIEIKESKLYNLERSVIESIKRASTGGLSQTKDREDIPLNQQ